MLKSPQFTYPPRFGLVILALVLALISSAFSAEPGAKPDPDSTVSLPALLAGPEPVNAKPEPDSTFILPSTLSDWILPEAEILLANGVVAGYNIFWTQAKWARVSGRSIAHNFVSNWEWDYDQFHINQFGHPYQGGLYFSAARHYGHGFYTSMGYAALGSLQWEYIMETDAPSYNDFITTTLGGAMLGEISYRMASSVLDDNTSGLERFSRELIAGAINPVHGINRILNGDAWQGPGRSRSPKPHKESIVRLSSGTTLATGSTAEGEEHNPLQRVPKANSEMLVIYGDPYRAQKPFDYFLLSVGMNVINDPVATISARAQVHKLDLFHSTHGRGLFMIGENFDYLNNGIYKLGTTSIGVGYSHRYEWGNGYYHTFHTQAAGIIVGGVSTEFFKELNRDYNLGPGAFGTTRITIGYGLDWRLALITDRYWLHTRSGAKGDEIIGVSIAEAYKSVWGGFGALLSYSNYDRSARYRDFGTRVEFSQETKALLTYSFH